jgi:RNA polymerase sigma-70 factor (ECF subfamily)
MDDASRVFERLRPRLHGIAHRMLGSAAEAEEVVQDAWPRWQEAAKSALDRAEARLVIITTRLCLERLGELKHRRDEPLLTGSPATPEQMLERAEDIAVAFLALLERLAPEARTAFLLREMFDADYDELSRTIGKSEAASRQMVRRAKKQLRDERPHYASGTPTASSGPAELRVGGGTSPSGKMKPLPGS